MFEISLEVRTAVSENLIKERTDLVLGSQQDTWSSILSLNKSTKAACRLCIHEGKLGALHWLI